CRSAAVCNSMGEPWPPGGTFGIELLSRGRLFSRRLKAGGCQRRQNCTDESHRSAARKDTETALSKHRWTRDSVGEFHLAHAPLCPCQRSDPGERREGPATPHAAVGLPMVCRPGPVVR